MVIIYTNKVNLIDYILLFQIPTLSFLYELFYQTYYVNYISFLNLNRVVCDYLDTTSYVLNTFFFFKHDFATNYNVPP